MRWELNLKTDAMVEPVSTADAKTHLRVTATDEDDYIDALVRAARMQVERMTNRALVTQTWELSLPDWPWQTFIRLPRAPLQSVTSIEYVDRDGDTQTVSTDVYGVDTASTPGRVFLKPGETWPGTSLYEGTPITITYKVGYGDDAADVPEMLTQAVKLLLSDMYENRETVVIGETVNATGAVQSLVAPYRVRSVFP